MDVTAIVLTSPIPSHPSIEIIQKTLDSIKFHLPAAKIIVLADGVRPEQEERRRDYYTFIGHLANHLSANFPRAHFSCSHKHIHQIGMMRRVFPVVKTKYILFMEHDTPLLEVPIEWDAIGGVLDAGGADLVRFLPEAEIHPEHAHLMQGEYEYMGVKLTRTIQFSARPHLAHYRFYRKALNRFSPEASSFLEDFLHGVCQAEPWDDWRMAIYTPEGNKKRSTHLDGRAGAEKFDESQRF